MGFIQKDALQTSIISYAGLALGYINKVVFFIWFLTAEQIGLVNLLVGVGLLFAQLANLGSINAILKFFPFFRNKEQKNFGFLSFMLLIVFIGIFLFSILTFLFRDYIIEFYGAKSPEFVDYYLWIIPIGVANVLFLLFESYLRSLYKNRIVVFSNDIVLRALVTLLLVCLGMKLINFETFLIIHSFIYFIPLAILMVYSKYLGELHLNFRKIQIRRRFRKIMFFYSFFNYLNTLGVLLVITIDSIMIASMLGLKATGIYTTIIYLTSALQIPYRSLIRITSPIVVESWKQRDMEKMKKLYVNVSSVSLFAGICLFMSIWINRTDIFALLPAEYLEGIPVFLVLMIGRLFDFYSGLNGSIFISSKKYKYDMVFTLLLLVTVTTLNNFLIPIYGIVGAAISTSIAIIGYNIGRLVFIYYHYKIHPFTFNQLKVLALFIGNVIFFELIRLDGLNFFVSIGLNLLLFFILFILPIYLLKLEPNSVSFMDQAIGFIRRKK